MLRINGPTLTYVILKLCSEGHHGEGFPHGETFLSVYKQRVGLDFEVVLQPRLVSQQVL